MQADRNDTGGAIERALDCVRNAYAGEHVVTVWDAESFQAEQEMDREQHEREVCEFELEDEAEAERLTAHAELANILTMEKAKRGRGRPKLNGGKFYIVQLEQRLVDKAKAVGAGKVAPGIRAALECAPVSPPDSAA